MLVIIDMKIMIVCRLTIFFHIPLLKLNIQFKKHSTFQNNFQEESIDGNKETS